MLSKESKPKGVDTLFVESRVGKTLNPKPIAPKVVLNYIGEGEDNTYKF